MLKFKIVVVSIFGFLALAIQSPAQTTNEFPLTALETLEDTTGQLVVKATDPVGFISLGSLILSVECKEDTVVGTGRKQYGIDLLIQSNNQLQDRAVVDYDELDSLMRSVDYLSKVSWSVTSLSSFNGSYTTTAGLRVAAFSSKRSSKIEFVVRSSRLAKGIPLTPNQVYQFYTLLGQAKAKIDALRNPTE